MVLKRLISCWMAWLIVGLLAGAGPIQASESYYETEEINPGLPTTSENPNLETPQACVEHFLLSARHEQWHEAALALNFRLLAPVTQEQAEEHAKHLHYLINQNLWIDWSRLPDRPDGVAPQGLMDSGTNADIFPRRSIHLGSIDLNGRSIPVRIERIKPANRPAAWLFSAQTVANIPELYFEKGPSWLAQQAPKWSRERILWRVPLWQWLALGLLVIVSVLSGWLVATVVTRKIASHLPKQGGRLIRSLRWPSAIFTAGIVAHVSVGSLLTLPGPITTVGAPIILSIIVGSATWLAVRVLGFLSEKIIRENKTDELLIDEGGSLARLTLFRYVLILIIVATGLSVLLISMDLFRTLGITLLSSAGAAAVILGLASHAVLGNLIAGLQIAITNPFRIGDTVIVEGYWGRVEEIRYTYVAVRTWDEKRLIFPVSYFTDHWFENWSKTDRFLIIPIYLKVDYRADIQAIRDKFFALLKDNEHWDGQSDDPQVLVTDCSEETMTVRLTCGGENTRSAWLLSCEIREQLMTWLQQEEDGAYLPRRRVVLTPPSDKNEGEAESTPAVTRGDSAPIHKKSDSESSGDGE